MYDTVYHKKNCTTVLAQCTKYEFGTMTQTPNYINQGIERYEKERERDNIDLWVTPPFSSLYISETKIQA